MITNRFLPPITTGRGIRNRRIAKFSVKFGWRIVVLMPNLIRCSSIINIDGENIKVFRVTGLPPFENFFFFKNWLLTKTSTRLKPEHFGIIGRIREICKPLSFPDDPYYARYIIPIAIEGLKIVKKEKIDVIYSACYPFSFHISALLLKLLSKLPWLAVFEDPWVGNPAYFKKEANILHKLFERKVVEHADKILIYGNYADPEYFFKTYSYLPKKKFEIFKYVLGYDPEEFNRIKPKEFNRFSVTYAGSFYNGQCDPTNFLLALKFLLDKKYLSRSDIIVNFIGDWNNKYEKLVDRLKLSHIVKGYGSVSHDECISYLKGSDCLLLIWRNFGPHLKKNWTGIIHGKIGEYIGAKKPILALVPQNHKMSRLIKSEKLGLIANPNDPIQIADALLKIYRGYVPFSPSRTLLEELKTRNRIKRFYSILDEIAKY